MAEKAIKRALLPANKSGVSGVSYQVSAGKWKAAITINRVTSYLGLYDDKEAAIAARKQAERSLGFHPDHGKPKTPAVKRQRLGPPTDDEFIKLLWSRVEIRGDNECWPWKYTSLRGGRGLLLLRCVRIVAPRVAYRSAHGYWPPKDLMVCHSCDNPPCCNPKHLWLGTALDNSRDCARKGRRRGGQSRPGMKEICRNGHPYDQDNAYRPKRACRICNAASVAAYKARKRQK